MNIEFLKSNRFWAIIVGAVTLALYQEGILPESYFLMVETIVGAFTAVRTVDRLGEKIGE